ncbi:MAG TPA: DHA2 family efflux MFS transporter permease subunit [Thermoleophilaceae bacterium]|nr:DHA2 family efflux MFS transporter permease subunit [Thermoleophilaceae bacterium]
MASKWWTLLVVCLSMFMLLLDVTIVNVALPDIQRELHSDFEDLQWVVDAYALALAALLLGSGSLADLLGRRRVFVVGLFVFVAASLLCGLSGSPLMLNLARALQGGGGAMMFATSLALIAQEFPPKERGTAFGIWGATTGFAVAVGPLAGGALTDAFGWEWIFLVNVPIGLATAAVSLARVPGSERDPNARIDWAGLVTFSSGLFCFVFALIRGNDDGWGSAKIVGLLVAAVVLLAVFVIAELRRDQPMLDLRLFRVPTFTGAQIVAFAIHASMFSMFLYIVLYMQNVLGYTPLETGVRFLPVSLLSFAAAPVAGKLAERFPVRLFLSGGLALVGLGLVLMSGIDPGDDWTTLLPGFILGGIGIGLINPPLATAVIGVVEPRRSGAASGINSTFRQVGTAVGIAGLGAILQSKLTHSLDARGLATDAAHAAYIDALNELFIVGAVIAFAGAVCALVLVRRRDFISAHA